MKNTITKGNDMKLLSEVMTMLAATTLTTGVKVETKTDAYHVIWDEWSLQCYLRQFGDVEVKWDSEHKVYRVPAFTDRIASYTAAKAKDCARWGCE